MINLVFFLPELNLVLMAYLYFPELNFVCELIYLYVDDAVDSPAPISRSVGDLTRLMDNIHKEQLTFDGKDKRKQRTSAILPTDGAPVETPVESIETLKRKHSLMRTLKVIIKCTRWLRSKIF